MNRVFSRGLSALLIVVGLLFVSSGVVSAHAHLKSSAPAAGSTVSKAPTTVSAVFENHSALATTSWIKVTDAAGTQVDKGDTSLDKADANRLTLVVSLKDGLADGVYTVNWKAVSEGDGSEEEGDFSFTVSSTAAPTTLPTTGGETMPMVLILIGAGLLLIGGLQLRRRAH